MFHIATHVTNLRYHVSVFVLGRDLAIYKNASVFIFYINRALFDYHAFNFLICYNDIKVIVFVLASILPTYYYLSRKCLRV